MFLAVRDGFVMERSDEIESLLDLDPKEYEVFEWDGPRPVWHPEDGEERPLDPRVAAQKAQDAKARYKRQRQRAMPGVNECLAMIYRDMKNGTTEYVDAVDAINTQFPRLE